MSIRSDKVDASNNTTDIDIEEIKRDEKNSTFYISSKFIVRIYFLKTGLLTAFFIAVYVFIFCNKMGRS